MENIFDLIKSEEWPQALDPSTICSNQDDKHKFERGEAIVDIMLGDYIEGLDILDFGTGEGHACLGLKNKKANKVIGYDIVDKFITLDNVLFTTNWDQVQENGPYDIILVYDVIDHIEKINSLEALYLMKSVLKPGGQIFLRYHPWVARHGGHFYEKINKAYIHNVLTDAELDYYTPKKDRLNIHKIFNTDQFYKSIALHSGLSILDENIHRKEIEPFFKQDKIKDRILRNCGLKNFPEKNFTIEFVDHVLIN